MTHDSVDLPGISHARLHSYVVGFVLSIVLTAIPFALVVFGSDRFPHLVILITITLAAIAQIVVQLHYFLHLDRSSEQSWNMLAIVFTVLIIAIMLLGTLWIMFDLHTRMM
ncbi:MAG: cytochrome o ubiquinol oxidase subunit IV [Sulfuriferula sp.]